MIPNRAPESRPAADAASAPDLVPRHLVPANGHELDPYRGWRLAIGAEEDGYVGHGIAPDASIRIAVRRHTAQAVEKRLRELVDEQEPQRLATHDRAAGLPRR